VKNALERTSEWLARRLPVLDRTAAGSDQDSDDDASNTDIHDPPVLDRSAVVSNLDSDDGASVDDTSDSDSSDSASSDSASSNLDDLPPQTPENWRR
jgi:hypothetical protein